MNRSRWLRLGVFALCQAAMAWRAPNLLLAPRFYAEEGKFHFAYAFEHGFLASLSYVHEIAGYVNLVPNVATGAATWVPLEYAPAVTTATAWVVQSIPFLIVLFGKSVVFRSDPEKIAGCAILLFAPGLPADAWLTTLHSQVHLGVIALLVLLEDMEGASPLRTWSYRALLAVGGLSGPYAALLFPVFALRAAVGRKREQVVQLAVLSLAFAVQIGAVYASEESGRMHPHRAFRLGTWAIPVMSFHHVGVPLFGERIADAIARSVPLLGRAVFGVLFLGAVAAALFDRERRRLRWRDPRLLLALAILVLAPATTALAMQGISNGRYAVLSACALLFSLLAGIRLARHRAVSALLAGMLCFSLAVGFLGYRDDEGLRCDGRTTDWKGEVARWRREVAQAEFWKRAPSGRVRICPGWRIELRPPAHRRPS